MVAQLKFLRKHKSWLEEKGDVFSEDYMMMKLRLEKMEDEVGDWTETIDYSGDDNDCMVLPTDIWEAAKYNNTQKILNWLGPLPVDEQRLNAKNPEKLDTTLVHGAVLHQHSDLLSILLQFGADVDPVDATGRTPFALMAESPEHYEQTRLLLEWGAEITSNATYSKDVFIEVSLQHGNSKFANLLQSEFGGRRCEIVNLPNRPDLIGKTCVVEKYLPKKEKYKVIFEVSKEAGMVGPQKLKRRDRTPDDCGYYIIYENGRTTRRDFASTEECQAFVASLTEGGNIKSGDENAEAVARAEEAADSLLAQLKIDSSSESADK